MLAGVGLLWAGRRLIDRRRRKHLHAALHGLPETLPGDTEEFAGTLAPFLGELRAWLLHGWPTGMATVFPAATWLRLATCGDGWVASADLHVLPGYWLRSNIPEFLPVLRLRRSALLVRCPRPVPEFLLRRRRMSDGIDVRLGFFPGFQAGIGHGTLLPSHLLLTPDGQTPEPVRALLATGSRPPDFCTGEGEHILLVFSRPLLAPGEIAEWMTRLADGIASD